MHFVDSGTVMSYYKYYNNTNSIIHVEILYTMSLLCNTNDLEYNYIVTPRPMQQYCCVSPTDSSTDQQLLLQGYYTTLCIILVCAI